jgi:hypothetical protein
MGIVAVQSIQAPTVKFDYLLDTVYPVLNRLHQFDGSRRFWGILLYRYLSKCLLAALVVVTYRSPPIWISSF